jgi:hypothetical protein
MQLLEVSCAVRPIYGSLGAKGLILNTGESLKSRSPAFGKQTATVFRNVGTQRHFPEERELVLGNWQL